MFKWIKVNFYSFVYFQTVKDPEYQYFIRKKINKNGDTKKALYFTPIDGLRKIKERNFAYHCQRHDIYGIIPKIFSPEEICDFREVMFRDTPNAIILKKHSPYREIMTHLWLWMLETGIAFKNINYWKLEKPKCEFKRLFRNVGFDYIGSLFIFLLLICFISIIFLIIEIFVSKSILVA